MAQNMMKTNMQTAPSPSSMYGIDDYMLIDGRMVLKPRLPSNSSSPGIRIDNIQGNYQSPSYNPPLPEPVPCVYPSNSGNTRNQDFQGQGLTGIRPHPSQAPESNPGQIPSTDPEVQRLLTERRLKEQQDRMISGRRVQLLDVRNEASYVQMMNPNLNTERERGQNQQQSLEGRRLNQNPTQSYNQHPAQGFNQPPAQGYHQQPQPQQPQSQAYPPQGFNSQLDQVNRREMEELRKRNATFQDAYTSSIKPGGRRNQGQGH